MTREEAIKVLSSYDVNGVWADVDGKPYNAEEQAEAFDMAIEALKRENHDGCDGCRYEENDELTAPCTSCKQNYTDKYTSMPKHDRDWIVGCIKHDGFIKTDRGDKANQIILEALKADRPMVIKCKPFLSEEDFKAFAEQVCDQNVILIPYEAEVVSTNTSTKSTNISTKSTNISTDTSADTMEVVRCKDCIHHEDFFMGAEGSLLCWKGGTDKVVSAMGYCECGERSEE